MSRYTRFPEDRPMRPGREPSFAGSPEHGLSPADHDSEASAWPWTMCVAYFDRHNIAPAGWSYIIHGYEGRLHKENER